MTEYVWSTVRNQITAMFAGQLPRAEDEQTIIDLFELLPQTVIHAATELEEAVRTGRVRWGWSALRARLERGTVPQREAIVDPAGEREKKLRAAERWLTNAGAHHDREDELVDALFGELGMLRDYAATRPNEAPDGKLLNGWHLVSGDQGLVARMLSRWRELRPAAELVDREAEERAWKWIRSPPGLRWSKYWDTPEGKAELATNADPGEEPPMEPLLDLDPNDLAAFETRRQQVLAVLRPPDPGDEPPLPEAVETTAEQGVPA